ncbi:uncharacterized protein LOC133200357 isoform X2 [Saccostrea echinata]|uniref:uncharacterized protein LOC133200357 isoform X1 n=1 Tax=Saccostrea echinata TaxID=191078 RepID=UPI002A830A3A|nr:uncharacterized protein LOC133200357 isoform X1 [Saccostrea echinata]XP_061192156.1 uncharacterized protein LOC133200357 isoform X2 [Saccostrea echinata]
MHLSLLVLMQPRFLTLRNVFPSIQGPVQSFTAVNMPKRKASSDDGKLQSKVSKKRKSTESDEEESKGSKQKKSHPKLIDPATNTETIGEIKYTAKEPTRNKKGELVFPDFPEFRPNMSPKEVLQAGSFGGTYFRPIKSSVTGKQYKDEAFKELPKDWTEGLNIKKQVTSSSYNESVNTYKVKCGGSLEMWEESGWIHKQDPYGWFQWYCRFYQGRRTLDDERQVGRWLRCAGPTGRWKNNLISKCYRSGARYNDPNISPVVRQTLQHWGYRLTEEDYLAKEKQLKRKKVV